MKTCVGALNNTFPSVHAKQAPKVSFKGFNGIKTLDSIRVAPAEEKYFKNGVPILAQYVPQGFFGVQKFIDEASRFLITHAVGNCTKLSMHDSTTNTGFLAHVDSIARMSNSESIKSIKKTLTGINPENLMVRHLRGCCSSVEYGILPQTLEFMKSLGIPQKNLIEEDLLFPNQRALGLFMDIKTGQTYNTERFAKVPKNEIDTYKNVFNEKEYQTFLKSQSALISTDSYCKAAVTRHLLDING